MYSSNIFTITNVSYNQNKGVSKLLSPCSSYNSNLFLIWSIDEYPAETLGMPGSPFTVKVKYTIFDKKYNGLTKSNYNSINGSFVYQIYSGTLPKYSNLGIPFGTYISNGISCDTDYNKKIMIILNETSSKLIIGN